METNFLLALSALSLLRRHLHAICKKLTRVHSKDCITIDSARTTEVESVEAVDWR